MSKWEMVRLGDAASFVNGYAFKPADWTDKGLPIIRIQNLTGSSKVTNYYSKQYKPQHLVDNGDVLISWSATLGVYEWNIGKALLNQHIFKVIFDKIDYDKRFFIHMIEHKLGEMSLATHGSTMKHITKKHFNEIPVPLPPLPIQRQIADMLDRASVLIKKRKAQIEKLDLLIKSRFVQMFGDPVTNTMGWDIVCLSHCVDKIDSGTSPVCEAFPVSSNGEGVLKLSAVTYGWYDETKNKALPENVDFNANCEVKAEDLLFTRKNTYDLVGMSAYVFSSTIKTMLPDLIFRLNTNNMVEKIYLWQLINNQKFRGEIKKLANGTAGSMPNISKKRLNALSIPLPPLDLQTQFAAFVHQVEAQRARLQQSLTLLERNYKSLMQKCFRGEIF